MDVISEGISESKNTLTIVQNLLKDRGIKALLLRSTDSYFNEYVPKSLSIRTKLTGFDGSVGDALITTKDAHLFVDGRYSLQAKTQARGFTVHVSKTSQSIEQSWLNHLNAVLMKDQILAYDPSTVDIGLFEKMTRKAEEIGAKLDEAGAEILQKFRGEQIDISKEAVIDVSAIAGASTSQKLEHMKSLLHAADVSGYLVVKLDDIAWLTNLRSYIFPFQSSLPGIACILGDQIFFGVGFSVQMEKKTIDKHIAIVPENEIFDIIAKNCGPFFTALGIDETETSKAHESSLRKQNIKIKKLKNPLAPLKAIKNEKELLHLRSAFKKADNVVYQTQNFVVDCFEKQKAISEGDVLLHIRNGFKKSGSPELSFRPICAGGKNGAIIHYGTPDHQQALEEGALFLLDTGAYYEGGYATDLTRTFLAAKSKAAASVWQKEMFTLVLKASIKGLSARLKRGSLGMQLDALVRSPLWQRGLDFAHGTGHGVGINVHEFPPRIGPTSTTELLEGHVFSIEPGLYFENLGGVRIENLATLVEDPDDANFLRVLPLTFCPFDERLIEEGMLNEYEKAFLAYFLEQWASDSDLPQLPPLPRAHFLSAILNF